jgi:choline dehydrogenase-like flavoprotein
VYDSSSSAADRRARSWPTASPPKAPTRSCSAKPARTRRRQRTGRNSRQLSGNGVFRSALPLDRTQGHDPDRQSTTTPKRPPARLRKYEQARVLGGGSSDQRPDGQPRRADRLHEWEARGAAGWNWNDVLPYFKKVERDLDFDGPCTARTAVSPSAAFREGIGPGTAGDGEACKLAGFKFLPDQNRRVRRRLLSGDALQSGRATRSRPRWAISIAKPASAPT